MFTKIQKFHIRNKIMHKITFIFLITFFYSNISIAQCAMCRAAIESEGNGVKAQAVNDGIVYLMLFPYLLAAGIGYAVYKIYKNKKG